MYKKVFCKYSFLWQNFVAERLKIKRFYFFNKKIITQSNQKIRDAANACIFHAPCVNL